MLWSDMLTRWKNGIPHKYPKSVKGRFLWNTSVCSVLKNGGKVEFKQRFRTADELPQVQNTASFQEYIQNSKNKYVVSFPNLSRDTMLVVPMPVRGKNYATLRDFIDNAPEIQQQEFWKHVAEVATNFMNKHGKVWISVHGFGVPYTHVRISTSPKYYFDNKLKDG